MARSIGGYVGIGNPILAPDQVFAAPSNTASGDGAATFTFSAPDNEGLTSVTLYVIVAITSGAVAAAGSGTSSPITVSGLTNGTAYTFVIFAINDFGISSGSFASDAVTPIAGRGLSFGGRNQPNQNQNTIEYVVIATTGNGTDFGDLQAASETRFYGGHCCRPAGNARIVGRWVSQLASRLIAALFACNCEACSSYLARSSSYRCCCPTIS